MNFLNSGSLTAILMIFVAACFGCSVEDSTQQKAEAKNLIPISPHELSFLCKLPFEEGKGMKIEPNTAVTLTYEGDRNNTVFYSKETYFKGDQFNLVNCQANFLTPQWVKLNSRPIQEGSQVQFLSQNPTNGDYNFRVTSSESLVLNPKDPLIVHFGQEFSSKERKLLGTIFPWSSNFQNREATGNVFNPSKDK